MTLKSTRRQKFFWIAVPLVLGLAIVLLLLTVFDCRVRTWVRQLRGVDSPASIVEVCTASQLHEQIQKGKCVVILVADWSITAQVVKRQIEVSSDWQCDPRLIGVSLVEARFSELAPSFRSALIELGDGRLSPAGASSGYGTMFWTVDGELVDIEERPVNAGLTAEQLFERTLDNLT